MKIIAATSKTLFILATCMFFMGCASFKGHNLPEVGVLPTPSPDAQKPTATFVFLSEADIFGKRPSPEYLQAILEAEFVGVLRESGYFGTVEKGDEGKDLAMNVHLVDSGNAAAILPALITGFSLYTIPSWATDKFGVVCIVKTTDGKQRKYELEDSSTLVQWLPMILAFPFNMPNNVPVEVRKNIYKNLILKMQEDGLFSGNYPSFGDSTSEEQAGAEKQKHKSKIVRFVAANYNSLVLDLSKGSGDHLTALLNLLEVSEADRNGAIVKIKPLYIKYEDPAELGRALDVEFPR